MSSYGKNKTIAAIALTIAFIIALRVTAELLMPDPAKQKTTISADSSSK
jgi:hypothetical protein